MTQEHCEFVKIMSIWTPERCLEFDVQRSLKPKISLTVFSAWTEFHLGQMSAWISA